MWMLDKEQKKEPLKITIEIKNVEERIKELEEEELVEKEPLMEFDEDLFSTIAKQIIINKNGRIIVEFINGTTMEVDYEKIRKDE